LSDVNDNPNISGARQFLRDYIGSNQDIIVSWLNGGDRENFGAELILLSLEARKIGDTYDLSGIALGSAMSLFKTVEGGVLAAQKVVEYNIALGEAIPTELLHFLENPPKSKKQIGPSAKYARRDLLLVILLKYLVTVYKLPLYPNLTTLTKATNQSEMEQATAIGVLQAELAPLSDLIAAASPASLERATRAFEARYPWF
jgi:hypothetical protein